MRKISQKNNTFRGLAALVLPVLSGLLGFAQAQGKPSLVVDGKPVRDLNANGKLDPYEDWRVPVDRRVDDLLAQMTREEKAAALMHGTLPATTGGGVSGAGNAYDTAKATDLIVARHVTSAITRLATSPAQFAAENNRLQAIAEGARLGIPLTISTDPRNHFQFTAGAAVSPSGFSQWPEMLGMAAIGNAALVRRFGDVARQEYRAVGIHMGLSPQADLATEPRWPRVTATFGEDADLSGRMVAAYVEGFQGSAKGLRPDGVAMVVKHFAGYGAAKDGFDSHNRYGRFAHFPGGDFDYHVKPFRGAFRAGVAGVMPTYSIFENLVVNGKSIEQVGGGYNHWLLTDILRGREHFDGLVLSDWAITQDCGTPCRDGAPAGEKATFAGISTAWGVESLSKPQRFAKGIQAGLDQFGGTEESEHLLAAMTQGLVSEARIDDSVRRVLRLKFQLGLFENPYVDAAAAEGLVGKAAFRAEGEAAQRRALVLLENTTRLLPLAPAKTRLFLQGISADAARRAGFTVATTLDEATHALIRAETPHQMLHPGFAFGSIQHEGDLEFKPDDPQLALIRAAAAKVPTIVSVMLDRPAILTNVKPLAAALLGDFGISDEALLDVLAGRAKPEGRLPFELPASMDAVRAQKSDLPHDSAKPLYPFGFGRRLP